MARHRLAAVECGCKETDRQLKEQFILELNGNDMLVDIITELTKTEESNDVTSEEVLTWTKRVEGQNFQSVVMNSLKKKKRLIR